jgi:hypothetical protein
MSSFTWNREGRGFESPYLHHFFMPYTYILQSQLTGRAPPHYFSNMYPWLIAAELRHFTPRSSCPTLILPLRTHIICQQYINRFAKNAQVQYLINRRLRYIISPEYFFLKYHI